MNLTALAHAAARSMLLSNSEIWREEVAGVRHRYEGGQEFSGC